MKLNLDAINKAIDEAYGSVVAALDTEFQAVIEDTNEFADIGLPDRDIIDSGRLKDSQVVNAQGNHATWAWDPQDPDTGEHYAAGVYAGFYAYGGSKYIPGRHFPERAVKRLDPVTRLTEELQKQGIEAKVVRNDAGLLS